MNVVIFGSSMSKLVEVGGSYGLSNTPLSLSTVALCYLSISHTQPNQQLQKE